MKSLKTETSYEHQGIFKVPGRFELPKNFLAPPHRDHLVSLNEKVSSVFQFILTLHWVIGFFFFALACVLSHFLVIDLSLGVFMPILSYILHQVLSQLGEHFQLRAKLVRAFWYPMQWMLRLVGQARLLKAGSKKHLTLHIPVDVVVDVGAVPQLHVVVDVTTSSLTAKEVFSLPEGEPVKGFVENFTPQHASPQSASVTLDPLRCVIELSADPDDPRLLCLEVRDKKSTARCRFAMSPQDFNVESGALENLPRIKRAGLKLETNARRKLLKALSSVADLQGIHLPALMRQTVSVR